MESLQPYQEMNPVYKVQAFVKYMDKKSMRELMWKVSKAATNKPLVYGVSKLSFSQFCSEYDSMSSIVAERNLLVNSALVW